MIKFKNAIGIMVMISAMIMLYLLAGIACAQERGAGLVLNVEGKAQIIKEMSSYNLRQMSIIDTNDIVKTGEKSSVKFIHFSTDTEYTIGAGSKVKIMQDKVEKIDGTLLLQKSKSKIKLPAKTTIGSNRILGQTVREVATSSLTRSIIGEPPAFLSPREGASLAEGEVELAWRFTPEESKKPRLVISDSDGKEIYGGVVTSNSFVYPQAGMKPLAPGKVYTAELSAAKLGEMDSERIYVNFSVLDKKDIDMIAENKKKVEEELSQNPNDKTPLLKMLFVYMNYGLYDDALKTGLRLESSMPDNPVIMRYISYIYSSMGNEDKSSLYKDKAEILEKGTNILR